MHACVCVCLQAPIQYKPNVIENKFLFVYNGKNVWKNNDLIVDESQNGGNGSAKNMSTLNTIRTHCVQDPGVVTLYNPNYPYVSYSCLSLGG